jgi:two-component system LytT family sensor kinase
MVVAIKSSSPLPGKPTMLTSFVARKNAAAPPLPQMPFKILLLLTAAFWLFVTLTDVLYGYSMQINAGQQFKVVLFVVWYEDALQHLLLFPILLICFAASLRTGWAPTKRVLVQIWLGAIFAAVSYFAQELSETLLWGALMPREVAAVWTASFVTFFMTYSFGALLVTAFAYYQRFRDAEVRNSVLEQSWSNARLAALRMQLSPHTLFNLLHTIRGHINQEPQIARSMVVQLAELLRRSLSAGQRDFSLLTEELAFVRLYLELQQQRFAERLDIVLIEGKEHADIWIPSLILQPLVENAVVHGLAGHDATVLIRVEVQVGDESVTLCVVNTIAKQRTSAPDGIGLTNVRERLDVQFGAEAEFISARSAGEKWTAKITIPVLRERAQRPIPRPNVVNIAGSRWTS